MTLSKRNFLQLTAIVGLAPLSFAASAQISMAAAINRCARFRALSQRTAKAYLQIQQEIMPDNARDIMASAQRLIQIGFDDLAKANLNAEQLKMLNALQSESSGLNAMVAASPTRDGAIAACAQADKMLAVADKLTASLEATSKQSSAKLVNMAGRQRMLSQRLAKNYFLAAAGAETKVSKDLIQSDREEFKAAMATLSNSPISTNSIRNELQLAQSQWTFFEAALGRKRDLDSMRTIATTSERLLEVNNNLTMLYEAALKDILGST